MPLYNNIASGYTSYNLYVSFNLSSVTTARIYEMLCSWVTLSSQKEIFHKNLRDQLGLEGRYPNAGQFKQKILEQAQKELKENADVWFEITGNIKQGRKVIGWEIRIFKKGGAKTPKILENNQKYLKKSQKEKPTNSTKAKLIDFLNKK